jgi:hypothetical protein
VDLIGIEIQKYAIVVVDWLVEQMLLLLLLLMIMVNDLQEFYSLKIDILIVSNHSYLNVAAVAAVVAVVDHL